MTAEEALALRRRVDHFLDDEEPDDGGRVAVQDRDLERTMAGLGVDGAAWRDVVGWVAEQGDAVFDELLGPLSLPPKHPLLLARFGLKALWPAKVVAKQSTKFCLILQVVMQS